jgi:hypothetical protein
MRLVELLSVLVLLGTISTTAVADDIDIAPDPGPSDVTVGSVDGTVLLRPGTGGCYDAVAISSSIHYYVDVVPNLGHPKARLVVWHAPFGGSFSKVFKVKATGLGALDETFNQPGWYQLCADYPIGQLVDGSAFDFMLVETIVNGG